MKKLAFIFGMVFWGSLFAAAAEDALATSEIPQKTILSILTKEIIEGPIFNHLSAPDQLSFALTCKTANSFRRSKDLFNMAKIEEDQIPDVAAFLSRNIVSLEVRNLRLDVLEDIFSFLGAGFRFNYLTELDLSHNQEGVEKSLLVFGAHVPKLRSLIVPHDSEEIGIILLTPDLTAGGIKVWPFSYFPPCFFDLLYKDALRVYTLRAEEERLKEFKGRAEEAIARADALLADSEERHEQHIVSMASIRAGTEQSLARTAALRAEHGITD